MENINNSTQTDSEHISSSTLSTSQKIKKCMDNKKFKNDLRFIKLMKDFYYTTKEPSVLFLMLNKKIGVHNEFLYKELFRILIKDEYFNVAIEILQLAKKNKALTPEEIETLMKKIPEEFETKLKKEDIRNFLTPKKITIAGEVFYEQNDSLSFDEAIFYENDERISFEMFRINEYLESPQFLENKVFTENFYDVETKKLKKPQKLETQESLGGSNSIPLFYNTQELEKMEIQSSQGVIVENSSLLNDLDIKKDFEDLKNETNSRTEIYYSELDPNSLKLNDLEYEIIKKEEDKFYLSKKVSADVTKFYVLKQFEDKKIFADSFSTLKVLLPEFKEFEFRNEIYLLYEQSYLYNFDVAVQKIKQPELKHFLLLKLIENIQKTKIINTPLVLSDYKLYEENNSFNIKLISFNSLEAVTEEKQAAIMNYLKSNYKIFRLKNNFINLDDLKNFLEESLENFNKRILSNDVLLEFYKNN